MAGGVRITNHGHSSLLIKGGGQSVLLNPFKAVGCAAGLKEPRLTANVILASSELADEGARVAKGVFLVKPGSYRVNGLALEGFTAPHDRFGGRRYGLATLWVWNQGGLRFAHLGGSAAPLSGEDKVLLGRPDVLIIAVGGGAKVYDGIEAAKVVRDLRPKRVIPVHYQRGTNTSLSNCDQGGVQPFLDAMQGNEVRKVGKTLYLKNKLSDQTVINVMR
ncbi:MBL fold metallo-hydrolase [Prochlorococcus sp. MIT 1307]|uniref:MBL fold metallo-hydrolase n=1 Tax=Prochlorococcus sp. MIT 1307 TaxID=3096219 RepID=UPI002A755D89|nr:MBL fold metallo-hydrolase [Prochlorococcus sp. MIT 1307]